MVWLPAAGTPRASCAQGAWSESPPAPTSRCMKTCQTLHSFIINHHGFKAYAVNAISLLACILDALVIRGCLVTGCASVCVSGT